MDDPGLPDGIVNGSGPVITGDSIGAITANSMEAFAAVSKHQGAPATKYGFYVNRDGESEKTEWTAESATTGNNGETAFSVTITNLLPGTKYTVRAFARNRLGEGAGVELKKQTTSGLGSIATLKPDNVKGASATLGGHILEHGEGDILSRGVFRSRRSDMSVKDTLPSPLSVDSFAFTVNDLDTMATYYVQAFVHNKFGFFTGETDSFTTKNGKPEFEYFSIDRLQYYDASFTATLATEGDAQVSSKGFCWSETPNPTINNSDSVLIVRTYLFEGTIPGLKPLTKYYARAFAGNTRFGTTYSDILDFTTKNDQPVVDSAKVFSISDGSVGVEAHVTSAGMGKITDAGYCWATHENPTVINNYKVFSHSEGPFRNYLTTLRGGATFYARAFAQNDIGQTAYSKQIEINTPPIFTSMPTFPGEARLANSSASCVIGNAAYMVGGDKGVEHTRELWSYNASDSWNQLQPFIGTASKWQTAVGINDVAYVFGGVDANDVRSNDMYRYLPNQNRWELIPTTNTPHPLHSAAGAAVGSQIYLIGGSRDSILNEVWTFNPYMDSWEAGITFPVKQYGGIAVTLNNVIYAGLGLSNTSGTVSSKKLWSLAYGADAWTEETPLPTEAGHIREGVAYKGVIYVVDNTGQIWKYDPSKKEWKVKSKLPASNIGDSQHCMFVLNDMIYIGLGVSQKSLLKYDPAWDQDQ
jgi:N-acetylneuraminic acid mutarotase